MNRLSRLIIAVFLVGGLAVVAVGVWAAPVFRGTVPNLPGSGTTGGTLPINMGTALFTPQCTGCTVNVNAIGDPGKTYAPPPSGLVFQGDAFKVDIQGGQGSTVKVSFAFPPGLASKNVKIYKLNTDVTPSVWVEVPGAVTANGMISVDGGPGVYALIGNP